MGLPDESWPGLRDALLPAPNMRIHPLLDGLYDLGIIVSQGLIGAFVPYLNLGIYPPKPIQPGHISSCGCPWKREFLQVRMETLKTPPSESGRGAPVPQQCTKSPETKYS